MKLKICLAAGAILLSSMAVIAQEHQHSKMQMSTEQKAAMDAMMKAATPGDAHKKLSSIVGTWDAKVTMWMDPAAPPTVSSGTSKNKWVLGGRWIQQNFSGTMMGRPFSGIGYTGYDNIKKQYVATWMDDMSTQMMVSSGNASDDKTYEFSAVVDDPVTGKPAPLKEKMTYVDNDHHLFEMWGPAPDGKTYKMMEINYTRKKKS
jgi:hypothetical protein